jgi:hypothetical protein
MAGDNAVDIGFWRQVWRDAPGDLIVSASYVLAWLFAPWLSDGFLLAMVVAVLVQFFMFTPLLGVITPRGVRGIFWCAFGHAAVFALFAWIASSGGRHEPDWWAVAMVQAPLLARNLERLRRPPDEPVFPWVEARGPFLLLMPVGIVAGLLATVLPDLGLAERTITFRYLDPVGGEELKFTLMKGVAYFSVYAIARTAWSRLGGGLHRRKDIDANTVRRWRNQWLKSRQR